MTDRSIVFDRAAEYYDRTRGYPDSVGDQVAELLCHAGALGPESTVLEVGVGTGRIALPLATRVRRVVGVDLSRPMLARLAGKPGSDRVRRVLADASALPVADARFDAVVSLHLFHLLPAWQRAIAEVRRVLAPHGRYLSAADQQLLPELWEEAYAGMVKRTHVGVAHDDWDFPLRFGFRADGEPHTLRYPVRVAFEQFLADLEARVWSITWSMADDEHAQLVHNMRAAIIRRYGSMSSVLDVERTVTVRVFAPAG
ncbi:MAG TPA: class I SAM-dependent methyltransferase [Polyangiales bacterium]|nr:class I SAM-dependent methyltransferase [Polyangiales bacterium]